MQEPTRSEASAAAHYQRGLEAMGARELERAISEFRQTIELNSRHAEAFQELGFATYGSGGSLEDARTYLEAAIQIRPLLGDAHLYLGIVLNRLKRHDDSEAHFRMALSLTDIPAMYHSTFAEEFLWHNSRYGEAEEHFKAALRHDPNCTMTLRDYARMLACHGRDEEASRLFTRAIKLDPSDRHAIHAYNEFLRELECEDHDPDDCLRAAIDSDPDYIEGIRCLNKRSK